MEIAVIVGSVWALCAVWAASLAVVSREKTPAAQPARVSSAPAGPSLALAGI